MMVETVKFPDVPLTVIVQVPAGVLWLEGLLSRAISIIIFDDFPFYFPLVKKRILRGLYE